jgi:hypothetical protein
MDRTVGMVRYECEERSRGYGLASTVFPLTNDLSRDRDSETDSAEQPQRARRAGQECECGHVRVLRHLTVIGKINDLA